MNRVHFLILPFIFFVCQQSSEESAREDQNESISQIEEEVPSFYWSVDWHPENDQIALGGSMDTLRVLSADGEREVSKYPYAGTITQVKWHPAGDKLAISVQDGKSEPCILKPSTGRRIELDQISAEGARALGWNHTGELLAVGDYEGILSIFDADGSLLRQVDTDQKGLIDLDWHPNSDLIVAVGEHISRYDYRTDELQNIEDRTEDILMLCVDWHPGGQFFATGDYGDFTHNYSPLLQYWTSAGSHIKSMNDSKAEIRNLAWSEDGELLASTSEKIRLWNEAGEIVAQDNHSHLLQGVAWNGDTTQLIVTDDHCKIIFWDRELNRLGETLD
ncbi:MAG: hypothetical protein AAGF87_11150 [Bacteroidota bacterium]